MSERPKNLVFCQRWEESEQDWGVRPDGFSLHVSMDALNRFIKDYWDAMPDTTPEAYSRPTGQPLEIFIKSGVLKKLIKGEGNLRFNESDNILSVMAD